MTGLVNFTLFDASFAAFAVSKAELCRNFIGPIRLRSRKLVCQNSRPHLCRLLG